MIKNLLFLLVLTFPLSLSSQAKSAEDIVADVFEVLSENDVELNDNSQVFDDLSELFEHPVSLNSAKKSDLEKILFLTDLQIGEVIEYVKLCGPVYSKYQLQAIKGLSPSIIEAMVNFIVFDVEDVKTTKYFNGQYLIRDGFDLETASGYNVTDSAGTYYLGNKLHLYSKFQMNYGKQWAGGVTLDKDPGEPLFSAGQNYFDFNSGYVRFQGEGWLKALLVGDYHANFGQGLALWSGTNMGKGSEVLQIRKRGEGIKKYSSANELVFFRGVAATFQRDNLELTLFGSSKKRDACVDFDSLSYKSVATSLPSSGYHRTSSEREAKNVLRQSIGGVNVNCRMNDISFSVGGYAQRINVDSIEVDQVYQSQSYLKPESFNCWLSYNYGRRNYVCFGELSSDQDGDLAVLNGIQFKPANNVSVSLLHRYFSNKYYSEWSNAFAESSTLAGESGFYMGLNVFPVKRVEISAYADIFKFNWLRYGVDMPSDGYELSLKVDYTLTPAFKVYLRYREKAKMENVTTDTDPLNSVESYNLKRLRVNAQYSVNDNWRLQFRLERCFYKKGGDLSEGFLAFTDVNYTNEKNWWALWLRYAIFDTDDYDSRIYTYENDLLYNFYSPSFQDEGSRAYIMGRLKCCSNVKFWVKLAQTWYAQKQEIGSGLQVINGNTRTNLKIQLQLKF